MNAVTRKMTMNTKNRNFAMPVAATAMPVKPKTAATMAMTRNASAQPNIVCPPGLDQSTLGANLDSICDQQHAADGAGRIYPLAGRHLIRRTTAVQEAPSRRRA